MIPRRIIFHHSADISTTPQFEKIDRYHKQQGYPKSSMGFWVGYHYIIEHDGIVRQAREEIEIGAHDQGENFNSLGICITGNFNLRIPTDAQARNAAWLVKDILTRWQIPITRFEPHRIDDDTDCPGTNVPDNWLTKEYLTREASIMHRYFWQLGEYLKLL